MKNATIVTTAALLFAGTALSNAETLSLLNLMPSGGIIIGGTNNSATATSAVFPDNDTYSAWSSLLTDTDKWYVENGYNNNIGDYVAIANSIVLVAGGPSGHGTSPCGAIRFSVGQEYFANVLTPITFSFDVALTSAGNNNSNHTFDFELLSSNESVSAKNSVTYSSKTTTAGETLLTETAQTVSLTLSATEVASLAASGNDAEFIFSAITNEVTGSNKGIVMSNFRLEGVAAIPEPSAFGLLAGLGALALAGTRRRRRKA